MLHRPSWPRILPTAARFSLPTMMMVQPPAFEPERGQTIDFVLRPFWPNAFAHDRFIGFL